MLTLGVGKAASAQIVELAAGAYSGSKGYGYSFFYVDEKKEDEEEKGEGVDVDGVAFGAFVAELVEDGSGRGVPWLATFVAGEGYVMFPRGSREGSLV
jgi:hypothetical protein